MMGHLRLYCAIALFIILFSCKDSAYLFLEEGDLELRTLAPGDWISERGFLPIEVMNYRGNQDLQIYAQVWLGDEMLWEDETSSHQFRGFDLPSLLEQGEYRFLYRVMDVDRLLEEKEIPFFYYKGNYSLKDIQLFPPHITPGSAVTARIETVESNLQGDPWFVWTMGDEIVQEAYYSQQGHLLHFHATEKTGVYPIEVNVFPGEPVTWEGPSPYRKISDLLITWGERTVQRHMNEDYSLLYARFDGSMDLHSLREAHLPLHFRDRYMVEYSLVNGVPGAIFRSPSFMDFDGLAMPVKDGHLISHSQTFYLLMEDKETQERETLFTTRSPGDGLGLSLIRTGDQLIASFRWDNEYHRIEFLLEETQLNRPLILTLGLQHYGNHWEMSGYLDGEFYQSVYWQGVVHGIVGGGETIWGTPGGASGFEGALYSWMVYSREEKNRYYMQDDIFFQVKEFSMGDRLIFAEGFDGQTLQRGFRQKEGKPQLDSSQLILGSGEILESGSFLLEEGTLFLELDYLSQQIPQVYLILDGREYPLPYEGEGLELNVQGGRINWIEENGFNSIYLPESAYTMDAFLRLEATAPITLDSMLLYRN